MLKVISNVSRRVLVLGALALCLMTTTAWALTVQVPFQFPGVDAGGNLDVMLGKGGFIYAIVNTKTGKWKASGKAKVQNLSGKKQTWTNIPFMIPGVTFTSSSYSCSKKGDASASASGMGGF